MSTMRSKMIVLFSALSLLTAQAALPHRANAQPAMRPATKAAVGETIHLTLDKEEEKDLAMQLGAGAYYIVVDTKRSDDSWSNIFTNIDLLKSNGAMVKHNVVYTNETHRVARVGETFRVDKAFAARLRVKNGLNIPTDVWVTVQPVARKAFVKYGFEGADLKPLGIGAGNGKGGTLDKLGYAYHTIKLPPGKYDVSLYMKQVGKEKTNLFGQLVLMDAYGVSTAPSWTLNLNQTALDAREEKRLVVVKPTTYIFRVSNSNRIPEEYTVDIEKATD